MEHEADESAQAHRYMLADEDGDWEGPPGAAGDAIRSVEMHDGTGGDAPRPGDEVERGNPRPDPVGPNRSRPLLLGDNLEEIRAQLDDVVDEEADRD